MTIIPNLAVTNMADAVAFFQDIIGMEVGFGILDNREMVQADRVAECVFVQMKYGDAELMLQTVDSLAQDVPEALFGNGPQKWGTVYIRGEGVSSIGKMAMQKGYNVLKQPFQQWYGMYEVYIEGPDGHIICVGERKGDVPR